MSTKLVVRPDVERPELSRFSASQTKKFLQCPAAWFYSRQMPRTSSRPAALGNETHARLERYLEGLPDAPDDVAQCTDAQVLQHLDADAIRRAEVMAKAARPFFPPGDRVKPEREFFITVELGKAKFQLSGFIDYERLHDDAAEVKDLKTTGSFARALTSDQLAADPQSLIYAAATFADHDDVETVHAEWVYIHSKNSRKMAGPRPDVTFTRGAVELGFRALFDSAWGPMLEAQKRKRAPKGRAPEACTQYHRGCEFDAMRGGPCSQHQRVPAAQTLLIGIGDDNA